ncbi:hypothetical protein SAMN05216218_1267 [Halorientalis regularis]|jgi:hypothetical protein|uniref:Uncharacterized protein n=1 Tax=Halorientalis regularis TaxID=660518 RepID=A0A1G7TKX5_9EURY|nr:hypothetical protein SAMN05216218_1267 [Halorientalis regularis]
MPKNTRLGGSIDRIDLEFVEREATPRLLMKFGIQLHLTGLSLSNTVWQLIYLASSERDPPCIIGFTRQIYSPKLDAVRITLRSTRP